MPDPVPWGCPCTENHAGSSVVQNKQFMRLFSSHSTVSWLMLWQDSIYTHDKGKIIRIFFISKALLFSNLAMLSLPHYYQQWSLQPCDWLGKAVTFIQLKLKQTTIQFWENIFSCSSNKTSIIFIIYWNMSPWGHAVLLHLKEVSPASLSSLIDVTSLTST